MLAVETYFVKFVFTLKKSLTIHSQLYYLSLICIHTFDKLIKNKFLPRPKSQIYAGSNTSGFSAPCWLAKGIWTQLSAICRYWELLGWLGVAGAVGPSVLVDELGLVLWLVVWFELLIAQEEKLKWWNDGKTTLTLYIWVFISVCLF